MINLSEEQLRKIEENKKAAILKKQQSVQKINSTSTSHNLTSSGYFSKEKTNRGFLKQSSDKNAFPSKSSGPSLSATFTVISEERFIVDMTYHVPSINVFKTINGRMYDPALKKWSFPLSEHSILVRKLRELKPEIIVNSVPENIVKTLMAQEAPDSHQIDWSKIDKTLRDSLMPFQVDGVRFGVSKKGRCLIADEMGLGKTIQALGIAHYYKQNWPLLIICPSSMRYPWQEAIKTFLPSVPLENVTILTTAKGCIIEGDVVISSYDIMKTCVDLCKKQFGVIIFDESHNLKSQKTARTKAALQLSQAARNVILLSGTPALSRPQELYSQIHAIDPHTFRTFYDFGIRYCDGKKDKFGWNFTGSSNLEELEIYLRKKIMIRRLKSEVMSQLPSKIRKLVVLRPNLVKTVTKQMQQLENEYATQRGVEKQSTLLSYFSISGNAKLNAVCEYIEDKLENKNKFLIFAHHSNVINGICELLEKKNVEYIRIDGSVSSEMRKKSCDRFQNYEECRVAVLSLKAANSGITLTSAQLVIFAELYWNPGELVQAEDRAHRIGQQDSVLVEYLVAKGTVDEHLWNLVQSKLTVLNKVGLSKDNFKDTDTKHLNDPYKQPLITSLLQPNTNQEPEKPKEVKEEPKFEFVNDIITEGMNDDDLFDYINLEEIENEYQSSSKKRKTSTDLF